MYAMIFEYTQDSDKWLRSPKIWGAWVALSVKCPTLDFGSGHDLTGVRSSPMLGSTL